MTAGALSRARRFVAAARRRADADALKRLRRHGALVVFGVGAAVIALVLVIVISQPGLRRVGYNFTPLQRIIGTLPAGAKGCQPEPLNKGTRAVAIHARPTNSARVAIRVQIAGAGSYDGTGGGGGLADGVVTAPLAHGPPPPRFAGTGALVTLCVINTGQAPLALLGAATGADRLTITQPGSPATGTVGRVRIDYLLSAKPVSLWGVLPMLPDRFATAAGSLLAPWLVVIGGILALLATVALLRSEGEVDED